jgi:hypothetical protein
MGRQHPPLVGSGVVERHGQRTPARIARVGNLHVISARYGRPLHESQLVGWNGRRVIVEAVAARHEKVFVYAVDCSYVDRAAGVVHPHEELDVEVVGGQKCALCLWAAASGDAGCCAITPTSAR